MEQFVNIPVKFEMFCKGGELAGSDRIVVALVTVVCRERTSTVVFSQQLEDGSHCLQELQKAFHLNTLVGMLKDAGCSG